MDETDPQIILLLLSTRVYILYTLAVHNEYGMLQVAKKNEEVIQVTQLIASGVEIPLPQYICTFTTEIASRHNSTLSILHFESAF